MCGIFAAIESKKDKDFLVSHFEKIKHRGPDNSAFVNADNNIQLGFHRLAINGQSDISNQPFFIMAFGLLLMLKYLTMKN